MLAGLFSLSSCETLTEPTGNLTGGLYSTDMKVVANPPPNLTPYPFDTCAVAMTRPLDIEGRVIHRVYGDQEVLLCCVPCVRAFDMNPEPFMPRILAAAAEGQVSRFSAIPPR